jgi:membrane protein
MKRLKDIPKLLKLTFDEWNNDGAPRLAAALAYYTAFSLAPLLVIIIGVFGIFVSETAIRSQIIREVANSVGTPAAEMVQGMIDSINQPGQGLISTILGFAALILGAMGAFGNLQTALDIIWDVDPKARKSGIKYLLIDRFLSFGMLLLVGFLLLVSMVMSTVISAVSTFVVSQIVGVEFLFQTIAFVLSFGVITLLFAMIFKFLPHTYVRWRDVWIGAAVTSALFTVGKTLLALYLAHSSPASAYGAAGAFVLILLWIYYSAQIVLFGAEFTQVYARRYAPVADSKPATAEVTPLPSTKPTRDSAGNTVTPSTTLKTPDPTSETSTQPEEKPRKGIGWIPTIVISGFWLLVGFVANILESRRKAQESSQD